MPPGRWAGKRLLEEDSSTEPVPAPLPDGWSLAGEERGTPCARVWGQSPGTEEVYVDPRRAPIFDYPGQQHGAPLGPASTGAQPAPARDAGEGKGRFPAPEASEVPAEVLRVAAPPTQAFGPLRDKPKCSAWKMAEPADRCSDPRNATKGRSAAMGVTNLYAEPANS